MRPALRTGKEIGRKSEFLRWRGAGHSSSHKRRSFERSGRTKNRARGFAPINRVRPSRPTGAAKGKKKALPQSFQRVFRRRMSDGKQTAAGGPNKTVAGIAAVAGAGAAPLIRRRRGGAEKPAGAGPPGAS